MIIDALDTRTQRPGLRGLARYRVINDPDIAAGPSNNHRAICEAAVNNAEPVYINYEHTRLDIVNETEESVESQSKLIVAFCDDLRSEFPGIQLSIWNRPDASRERIYQTSSFKTIASRLNYTRNADNSLNGHGVNAAQDFFTPSRYLPLLWQNYGRRLEAWAMSTLYAIRWCRNIGKPCFPFVSQSANGMPSWRVSHLFPASDMLFMLRFCLTHADGVYLWGAYSTAANGEPEWLQPLMESI